MSEVTMESKGRKQLLDEIMHLFENAGLQGRTLNSSEREAFERARLAITAIDADAVTSGRQLMNTDSQR
jgi:hypothetical protein